MSTPILSFHGGDGKGAINNLIAFPPGEPSFPLLSTATLSGVVHPLLELRGFLFDPPGEHLYVVNGYKELSQVLRFGPPVEERRQWRYESVYIPASAGLSHPFDLLWGFGGALFVSSQDTNRVTRFDGEAEAGETFAEGFKAVRGLAYDGSQLFVADSGDDRVYRFDAEGKESHHLEVPQPVHLLWEPTHGWLLIGSEVADAVFVWRPGLAAPVALIAKTVPPIDHTAGLALLPAGGEKATLFVASRVGRQLLSFPLDLRSEIPVWSPPTTTVALHREQLGDDPEFVAFSGAVALG